MPVSTDNQDYNEKDQQNSGQQAGKGKEQKPGPELTSDNLKGKKVDADPENPADKPAENV